MGSNRLETAAGVGDRLSPRLLLCKLLQSNCLRQPGHDSLWEFIFKEQSLTDSCLEKTGIWITEIKSVPKSPSRFYSEWRGLFRAIWGVSQYILANFWSWTTYIEKSEKNEKYFWLKPNGWIKPKIEPVTRHDTRRGVRCWQSWSGLKLFTDWEGSRWDRLPKFQYEWDWSTFSQWAEIWPTWVFEVAV